MKQIYTFVAILLILQSFAGFGQVANFPDRIEYKVLPFYKVRPDGKPGRAVTLYFKGTRLTSQAKLEIRCNKMNEILSIEGGVNGIDSIEVLLLPEVSVKQEATVSFNLKQGKHQIEKSVVVPAMRHWTVYVYPHSHVDIGYSNTQENVEFIHKRNIDQGIKLAEKTKGYPDGARYLWNTEVMWPLERYMRNASADKKKDLISAIQKDQLVPDAAYVHVNTSTCSEEELIELFKYSRSIEKLSGKPIDVMVQVDLPGMAWGVVPVMAHEGIRYIMMMPNGTRGNQKMTYALNQKPFWWESPDGKSKVLFFQPGSYGIGLGKGKTTGRPWFGEQDTSRIPEVVKTDHPRANFLDDHLFSTLPSLEKSNHLMDIYVVTWAMWDNALLDADLPDAVSSWNKEYAYPHLEIASAHQIMQTIEKRYGAQLPTVKGDYTEYWTDNMGVAAKENKMNCNAKERLLQAETIWTMLHPGQPALRADFDEAWRNIILGSEHTYAAENPKDPFFFNALFKVKQSYFREAEERSIALLNKALAPATDRSAGALGPDEGPSKGGVAVINTHSWKQGGLVTLTQLESQTGDRVVDDQGNEVLSQRLSTGELAFLASDVPPFGSRHYRIVKGKNSLSGGCKFAENTFENGLLRVELDKNTGNVIHIVQLSTGKDFVDARKEGGVNTFRWQPAKGLGKARADSMVSIAIKENGTLIVEVEVTSKASGVRSVDRRIRLINNQPWVEFSNTVDKLPLEAKDGIHFGFNFDIPESKTIVDIPYGTMELDKDQWPAGNRAWIAAQHWVDISNLEKGVTWCPLDAPLIESGDITANNTGSWDGKGDIWPSKIWPSATIYSWVMNNHWYTNTPLTQEGPVTFRYRVLPHAAYSAAGANRFATGQAQPLVHVLCDKNPIDKPFVLIGNEKVFITLLKPVADGKSTILRIRSFSDVDEPIKLEWPERKPSSVHLCEKGEDAGNTEVGNGFTVPAKGFITLRADW